MEDPLGKSSEVLEKLTSEIYLLCLREVCRGVPLRVLPQFFSIIPPQISPGAPPEVLERVSPEVLLGVPPYFSLNFFPDIPLGVTQEVPQVVPPELLILKFLL